MARLLPSLASSFLAWSIIGHLPAGGPTNPIGFEILRIGMLGVISKNLAEDGLQLWLSLLSLRERSPRRSDEPEEVNS